MGLSNVQAPSGYIAALLLAYAAPDMYADNAFRLTQLAIGTRASDIQRRLQVFTSAASVGAVPPPGSDPLFALAADSETFLKAIERLQDPPRRFCEALFWFWPSTGPQGSEIWDALTRGDAPRARQLLASRALSDADDIVSLHNLAVLLHMLALDEERARLDSAEPPSQVKLLDKLWHEVYGTWHRVLNSSLFPGYLERIVDELNDPRVSFDDVSQAAQRLPEALLQINALVAVRYANQLPSGTERRQFEMRRQLVYIQTSGFAEEMQQAALRAATQSDYSALVALCEHLQKQANDDGVSGLEIMQNLLEKAQPQLDIFDCLFSEHQISRINAHDTVAQACTQCLIEYGNATKQWRRTAELAQPLLEHAVSLDVREELQNILDQILALLASKDFEPDLERIVFARDTALALSSTTPSKGLLAFDKFLHDVQPTITRIDQQLVAFPRIHDKLLDQIAAVGLSCILTYGNATQRWKAVASRVAHLAVLSVSDEMKQRLATLQRSMSDRHPG